MKKIDYDHLETKITQRLMECEKDVAMHRRKYALAWIKNPNTNKKYTMFFVNETTIFVGDLIHGNKWQIVTCYHKKKYHDNMIEDVC